MKSSLFSKILLLLLATAFVAVAGFVAISAILGSFSPRAREPVVRAVRFLAGEAVHAYEEGGEPALADMLRRIDTTYDFNGVLTDAKGTALTGPPEDFGPLVEQAKKRRVFRAPLRRVLVFASEVQGRRGAYWFLLLVPSERFGFWFRFRQTLTAPHLWLLLCILLLSYALARHISKPVQQLRLAAERLGLGDFTARVNSSRQDELGELARTFDKMAEQIEHAVTAQRQLLQDVSHELRSPLSRLAVAVELARSSSNPSEALDRVEREAARLNELVSELLAMTREELRPTEVNLAGLLEEVVEDVQIEAQARQCRVVLDSAPALIVSADSRLLQRAVENVTRNAVYYTAPGTDVHVAAQRRNGGVEITVQDAGPGVPEAALTRIFDAFYRVDRDRDRSTGGVGLGLSIARRAIEMHGGTIAASNTHPGLRVVLRLPDSRVISEPAPSVMMEET
jgi:signal transduction histidine kinase